MRYRRWIICGWLWLAVFGAVAQPVQAATPSICSATVNGIINPAVADYLTRVASESPQACEVLIVTLNTPGGLIDSTWQIGEAFLNAQIPIVVYVGPQGAGAGSAGVFITYAAHLAAMAPNTNIGAAHPVAEDGTNIGPDLRDKVTNDAVSRIRIWAQAHERNADWAEQAVRQSVSIGNDEALRLKVINFVASDQADLLRQLDGQQVTLANGRVAELKTLNAPVRLIEMSFIERMLHLLGDPTIATMLISLGSMALYFELANPGLAVSGVLGATAIVLGLYGLSVLPVTMVGVILLGLSLVLFGVDIFATNHGALTFGGVVTFVLGALLLIDSGQAPGVAVARGVIAGVAVSMGLIASLIIVLVSRTRYAPDMTGPGSLIGMLVPVRSTIALEGAVFAQGALWKARSTEVLEAGEQAEVEAVDGLTLIVRRPRLTSSVETPVLGDGGR